MMLKQKGFTLIELMITLLLSTLLIAAIGKMFIDSGNSFRKQQALSYVVQDGRYVMEVLSKEFRRIGFLSNRYVINGDAATIFKESNPDVLGSGLTIGNEAFIAGEFNAAGFSGYAFDSNHLVLRYQLEDNNDLGTADPDYGASPCTKDIHLTAAEVAASPFQRHLVTLSFYVKKDANQIPVLYCKAQRENLDTPTVAINNPVSNAIELVSNVEKLLILYGVNDPTSPYPKFANQYLLASQVTDWTQVKSIRFYLVLRSEDKHITQKTPSYRIDGRDYTVDAANDKRIYKVFSSTISFRNQTI